MPIIDINLNLERDAWNWWEACNKVSWGVDWKQKIKHDIRQRIVGKTQQEAYNFLLPMLRQIYKRRDIKKYLANIQEGFNSVNDLLFERMTKVTNRPIYRENFTCFLTTFPRFPYNYEKGEIWISSQRELSFQLAIFIHELLHFQYFAYFGERVWDALGKDGHGMLKEAMTVILNDEFSDITKVQDEGYAIHAQLRTELLKLWRQDHHMDHFIAKAVKILPKYVSPSVNK